MTTWDGVAGEQIQFHKGTQPPGLLTGRLLKSDNRLYGFMNFGKSDLRRTQEKYMEHLVESIPLPPLRQCNFKPKDRRFKAIRKAAEKRAKQLTQAREEAHLRGRASGKSEANRAAANIPAENTGDTQVVRNNGQRRRRARAEQKLREQMVRLRMPANALQRTVALYQAAQKYECVQRPPIHPELVAEPRYLPRPEKYVRDGAGNLKLDRKGRPRAKKGAYRLIGYSLVPRDPEGLYVRIQEALEPSVRAALATRVTTPQFDVQGDRVRVLDVERTELLTCDPIGNSIQLSGEWWKA